MHSKKIVHRDIKLANILIDHNENIKIIDFGFSASFKNHKRLKILCGTPCYMSPEIVCRKVYNSKAIDVWALGVLFYRMVTGVFPFKGKKIYDLPVIIL